MSDDLIERLRKQDMRQRPGGYFVFNGIMAEAATALTEARAEIERLHRDKSAGFAFWRSIAKRFCDARKAALDRALAAESELSTLRAELDASNINHRQMATTMADLARKHEALRARVGEVVGPIAKYVEVTDSDWAHDSSEIGCTIVNGLRHSIKLGHLRAARQLNEDLK